jgi:hypothetical protein
VRALGAAAVAAVLVVPIGSAGESATRIIDRTLICQMPGEGFPDSTRFMSVSATLRPPWLSVSNGPSRDVRALIRTGPSGRKATGAVSFSGTECAAAGFRIPLSARGLSKARARSYACDVPSAVVIRVRAVFRRPTGFTRDPLTPSLLRARGLVRTAFLAVATRDRKTLAFASASRARGAASLFVAPSRCRGER